MTENQDRDCPVCHGQGTVKPGLTDLAHGGDHPLIIRNIPALICSQCEDQTYSGDSVGIIESIDEGRRPPTSLETVPVYDLAVSPENEEDRLIIVRPLPEGPEGYIDEIHADRARVTINREDEYKISITVSREGETTRRFSFDVPEREGPPLGIYHEHPDSRETIQQSREPYQRDFRNVRIHVEQMDLDTYWFAIEPHETGERLDFNIFSHLHQDGVPEVRGLTIRLQETAES